MVSVLLHVAMHCVHDVSCLARGQIKALLWREAGCLPEGEESKGMISKSMKPACTAIVTNADV
jgi:hypothetical protein